LKVAGGSHNYKLVIELVIPREGVESLELLEDFLEGEIVIPREGVESLLVLSYVS